ncbi:hypothetical protein RYX36_001153 [Vicia faba]
MPLHWGSFNYQMQLLASNSSLLRNFKHNANTLLSLMGNIRVGVSHERNTKSKLESNLLHSVNGSKWQNTFLGLWTAALQLVQRERDSKAGPIPRLDTCMCLLLSIITQVVANIVEEEGRALIEEAERDPSNQGKSKQVLGKRRGELITSLLLLGNS